VGCGLSVDRPLALFHIFYTVLCHVDPLPRQNSNSSQPCRVSPDLSQVVLLVLELGGTRNPSMSSISPRQKQGIFPRFFCERSSLAPKQTKAPKAISRREDPGAWCKTSLWARGCIISCQHGFQRLRITFSSRRREQGFTGQNSKSMVEGRRLRPLNTLCMITKVPSDFRS
jgi:hypothetical protein